MYEVISQISSFLSEPFISLESSVKGIPILSAFLLGLIGAVVPCQFTGNLGAITLYGNKSMQQGIAWKDIFFFILGKIVVFSGLGFFVWLLGLEFQQFLVGYFPWIRRLIGPMLILIGIYLIGLFKISTIMILGKIPDNLKQGTFGAFFIGVSFSLAFCPTMFGLFFITLMPIVLATPYGAVLPTIFAIGTSIPLFISILLIWLFNFDTKNIKKNGRKIGKYIQLAAGIFMILLGVLDIITYWV